MLLCTILLLTALSGLGYGFIPVPPGCDPNIFYVSEVPEFICGSDLKIYPNRREFEIARCLRAIEFMEIPLFMCYPQPHGEFFGNELDIGYRILDAPGRPQQRAWNPNINQRNIRKPISNPLHNNPYSNKIPLGPYNGQNLRSAIKSKIYPAKHDRIGAPPPIHSQIYPRNPPRQYPDARLRTPFRNFPIRTPQFPNSVPYDPYFMRPHLQPRFPPQAFNPIPFYMNMPLAEQIGNVQNLVPAAASIPCDEEPSTEITVPELKLKTGRKVPESPKTAKPKGSKGKGKAQKPTKKSDKENQDKNSNGDKVEEGPEELRQAVEERSNLKMLQNLSKNMTKKSDSADKKSGNPKAANENKPDVKKEPRKEEKADDTVDVKPRKDGDLDVEKEASSDAKAEEDKSKSEVAEERIDNEGSAT